MKTLRFALIAALISLSMMSMAQNNERNPQFESSRNLKLVSLNQALQNPDFCLAIRSQYNILDLQNIGRMEVVTLPVKFNNNQIMVRGTYSEWVAFFRNPLERMPSARDLKGNSGME